MAARSGTKKQSKLIEALDWLAAQGHGERIRHNDFAQRIEYREGEQWRALDDFDVLRFYHALHQTRKSIGKAIVHDAVAILADQARFHPVREYLQALTWDKTCRLSTWLHKYVGAEDDQYHAEVGAKWLIGAVARVHRPGCKMDTLIVLEGRQGLGKSTVFKILGGPHYAEDLPDLHSKDSQAYLSGRWIIEIGELAAMAKSEVEAVKRFISTRVDVYRQHYARFTTEHPRQCVFAGTTNSDDYLKDSTGARRFWPVRCGKIDLDGLERDRDQLWAEAVHCYVAGEHWWLNGELEDQAAEHQSDRATLDPWQDTIQAFISDKPFVKMTEVLEHALFLPISRQEQKHQNRAAACLQKAGWNKERRRINKELQWIYSRKS